ncbi:hypothetical protein Sango_2864500 [Sesamum angolense]|uniref:Reverse transcriptase zinc-binding domain-containing protein n=1 Tax=Sesamum angolense TaxID=2727404 RepID=A0AAE1T7A3_9LAMI|nr:hypothetical protein Sango_2864500 [Sesamum angolense]
MSPYLFVLVMEVLHMILQQLIEQDGEFRPIEEGGLGIKDILALNRALMSKHLWAVIKQDEPLFGLIGSSRFDFGTVRFGQLRKTSELGLTSTGLLDKLPGVIKDGQRNWPLITDIACLEITHMLPPILEGPDRISWKSKDGSFNTSTAYELFHPSGPKVFWSSLLTGSFKIPKNYFILWLAIMGRLSTLDKPWLHHIGGSCILCQDGVPETHDHLFFSCSFSRHCFAIIRQQIPFPWPHRDWQHGVQWASSRWSGKHVVNAAYRSLLASIVYHIWQERNARRFQQRHRPPSIVGRLVVEEIRQRIISVPLRHSVC